MARPNLPSSELFRALDVREYDTGKLITFRLNLSTLTIGN